MCPVGGVLPLLPCLAVELTELLLRTADFISVGAAASRVSPLPRLVEVGCSSARDCAMQPLPLLETPLRAKAVRFGFRL